MNISKDAKTAMSRAASVFILYATTWYIYYIIYSDDNVVFAYSYTFIDNVVLIVFFFLSANTHAMKGKRKTILPNDLFQALADMELDEFLPELKESLEGVYT